MTDGAIGTEARKVVTILFADITGSTGLGESLDPESLRRVLSRYFARMQAVIERHGGSVEKFIGDAVMAVFGVPVRHEDDALRAVRAAAEMRTELADLNEELRASWGVTIGVRTGVNTGEVLAAQPAAADWLVVGDAVNVAARLEQAAEPGEILLGDTTHRLVHADVRAEPAGPLQLKGKAAPVTAWRLVEVLAGMRAGPRRLDAVLVGRDRELAALEDAFRRVAEARTCEVVTVMGPAGVGKSRLVAELVSRLGSRATVVDGRCLPYGEGITFWPIASVVLGAIGHEDEDSEDDALRKVSALLASGREPEADDGAVRDGLAPLLGTVAPETGVQEISWAVRRFLERVADHRPLVVVLDDIHWGEATFLDLLDYLGDRIQAAPVLLVCQARLELLDARPAWMTGKPNASSLTLAPLTGEQTDGLIRGLLGGTDVPAEATTRIVELSEGNPLFVEETIRMLVDDGVLRRAGAAWTVAGDLSRVTIPPTILALLAARLDRLEPEERAVIERASVVGRSFWWGAISALSPEAARPAVGAGLQSLVRKELIRPDRSELRSEDAYRFAHILIRDAAYDGLPKAVRAELHERLADWLDRTTRALAGEYEEIVGYHLEQAHRALLELAPPDDRTAALAERMAQRLGAAGERAFARGDMPAAVNLLSRVTDVLPAHHPRRLELLPELAFALLETADFDRLGTVGGELTEAATATADVALQAHATIIGLWIRLFTAPDGWAPEAEREARNAIATFNRLGDERGVARGWSLLGLVGMLGSQFGPAEQAWSRAVDHAELAGTRREACEGLTWLAAAVWLGPTPADEGIRRCREVFGRAQGDRKAMATALFSEAGLEADLGHFDEARDLLARARALLGEVALPVWDAGALSQALGWALLLEGRPAEAEHELRRACDALRAIGEVSFLSTVAGILAEAVYEQGRYDEAAELTRESEASAGEGDLFSQVVWRSVRARCLAQRGDIAGALEVARACVGFAEQTDALDLHWRAHLSEARVLRMAGRAAEAQAAAERAVETAERKQAVVGVHLARDELRGLVGPQAPAGA